MYRTLKRGLTALSITRALKLGLTAITILTAGGFAFAPTAAEAQATAAQIANCKSNPFGWGSTLYGTGGCAETLGLNSYQFNAAKVRHCGTGTNYNNPECRKIVNRATAANWAKKNSTISTRIVPSRGNQLLRGSATGLDSNGVLVSGHSRLLMTDATFNGKALGGIVENGIASFVALRSRTVHAGILSGTDLGAPIRSSAGTKARWVGRINSGGLRTNRDFVLEVTFGTDRDGTVEAFVPYSNPNRSRYGDGHLRLRGRFDDTGVITGTVTAKKYNNNDRNNLRTHIIDSVVPRTRGGDGAFTGLIGEKGAVGAFASTYGYYVGGFVARPAGDVEGIAVYLKELCESNRAHEFCFVSDTDADTIVNNCIRNPFGSTANEDDYGSGGCFRTLGTERYRTETEERISFCNIHANLEDSKCTHPGVVTGICNNNPFGAVCLGHSKHNSKRLMRAKFCNRNVNDDACRGVVTTANICSQLPFAGICDTGYDDERLTLAKRCAADPDVPHCTKRVVTREHICSQIPFDSFCVRYKYTEYTRIKLARRCAADPDVPHCTDRGVTAANICARVPFASICDVGYDVERIDLARRCAADPDVPHCTDRGVSTADICSQIPFDSFCNTGYDDERIDRAELCVDTDNGEPLLCDEDYVTTANICSQIPFHSFCAGNASFAPDRAERITLCNNGGSQANNRLCTSTEAVDAVCEDNIFGTGCSNSVGYADRLPARISFCNIDGNVEKDRCTQPKVVNAICADNLFGTGCVSSDGYADRLAIRISLCNKETTAARDPLCTPTQVVDEVCKANLFGNGCKRSVGYADRLADRISFCNITENVRTSRCTQSEAVDAVCNADLFGNGCERSDGYDARLGKRIDFCNKGDTDADDRDCTPIDVVDAVCDNNLFGTGCKRSVGYADRLAQRISFCNITENVRTNRCTQSEAVEAVCADNLFGNGCERSDGYDARLKKRIDLCNIEGNLRSDDCTPTDVVDAVCKNNLFGVGCSNSRLYDGDRATRINDCNIAGNVGDDICNTTDAIIAICKKSLFGLGCLSHDDYDPVRVARIDFCNKESTEAGDPDCTPTDVVDAVCDNNLFKNGCKRSHGYTVRLGKRIDFCNIAGNVSDYRCAQPKAVEAVCGDNLFGTGCVNNVVSKVSYAGERKDRLELCDADSEDPRCTGTNLNNLCSYAPFSPVCSDRLDTKSVEIVEKFTDCRGANPSDLTCHGVSKKPSELKPDAATWLDGFVTIDNPNGLSSVVDINKGSQFLKSTKTGLKQDGIIALRPDVLHLSDVLDGNPDTSDELPSDEPAAGREDGVAFFYAYNRGWQFAAGILPETDLGAPLTRTNNTSAVWRGKFQSVFINAETFFDLRVNFSNSNNGTGTTGTIDAFIERKNSISSIDYASSVPHYYIKGDFDAKGRITGGVFAGTFPDRNNPDIRIPGAYYYDGVLRGLIGEDGAVGAFIGGESNDKGLTFHTTGHFAGGFVAVAEPEAPCVSAGDCPVNYDAWVNAARPLKVESHETTIGISATRNRFLTTTGTTLNKGRVSGSSIHVTMKTAKYGGVALAGDATDGFAYLPGSVNHVGILANTNLGAPLNAETAELTWKGSFVSAEGSVIITRDFILDIDFNNETVSATIPTTLYDFEGTFNTWGVIDGTITHADVKESNGIMTGLIGSEGAVGVFVSNADADLSYGGGFVARPTR